MSPVTAGLPTDKDGARGHGRQRHGAPGRLRVTRPASSCRERVGGAGCQADPEAPSEPRSSSRASRPPGEGGAGPALHLTGAGAVCPEVTATSPQGCLVHTPSRLGAARTQGEPESRDPGEEAQGPSRTRCSSRSVSEAAEGPAWLPGAPTATLTLSPKGASGRGEPILGPNPKCSSLISLIGKGT